MTKEEILDYVTETPGNTNRNVLGSMLNQFAKGSGGSGIEFITIPITNVFAKEVSTIKANITVIKGNTSFTFGDDYATNSEISPAVSVEVPMFGDKAKIWNIEARDITQSGLIVNDITTTGNVTTYIDEETNSWVIEVSGEGTISITWAYQD